MAVASAQVTVSNASATSIVTGADTDNIQGLSVAVRNADAAITVYLGGSAVTSATGFALLAGATIAVDLQPAETLYGRAASGSPVVHVLKTGA